MRRRYKKNSIFIVFAGDPKFSPSPSPKAPVISHRRYKKNYSLPSSQEIQKFFPSPSSKAPVIRADDTKKKISPTWQEIVFLSKTVKLVYSLFFSFFEGARHHAQRIERNSFFFTVVAKFSFSHAHRSMTVEGIDFKNIWTDAKPIGSIMKNCLYPIHL